MPNKLTWLVLASIAAIAVVGVAPAQGQKPFPGGRQIPGQQTITCPPTVPPTAAVGGTRPDGWTQFFTNGWLLMARYDQALHRIECLYRTNPGDYFTLLGRQVDKGLGNCTVTPDGKAVVCDQALRVRP